MVKSNIILGLFILLLILPCQNQAQDVSGIKRSPHTQQMLDSIDAIIKRTNFRNHFYENDKKLVLMEQELKQAIADKSLTVKFHFEYAQELLYAGQTEEAIKQFEQLKRDVPMLHQIEPNTKYFYEMLATAYLRLGEQQNCIANHSHESCLFPIQGKGIHQDRTGSSIAIEKYKEILRAYPDDLGTRWLLNLAYMTLGEYPHHVPKAHLLPPTLFQSEAPCPRFENIALNLGIDISGLSGGVITDDFNQDGWTDILISSWGMFGHLRLFLNDQKGGFIERTSEAGLQGLAGGLNLIQADYNNDGHLDFYVLRGAWRGSKWMGQLPNSLMKNKGDGTFEDVTILAGLYEAAPTHSAVWFDFNVDGLLDLFVGNESHSQEEPHPCRLFLNRGNGTFMDVAPQLGLNFRLYIKGVAAGDINNDNLPDLYLSVLNGPNKLILNRGADPISRWRFENVSPRSGVTEPIESFPTWFFDYNNDGWEDLFVASYDTYALRQQAHEVTASYLGLPSQSDPPRLYLNREGRAFQDVTQLTGLQRIIPTMGCNYGDLDNDGWLDFYLGTGAPDYRSVVPNRMLRNNDGQSFQDVTTAGNFGHVQKGHGVGFADFDHDGDQDIYVVMGGAVTGDLANNALFENPGSSNSWLNLRLTGTQSNRSAIGARIKITVTRPDGTSQDIHTTVNSGGSFGANSLTQEIGLGSITAIQNIAINWPNGNPTYLNYGSTSPNQFLHITESSPNLIPIKTSPVPFKKSRKTHCEHH